MRRKLNSLILLTLLLILTSITFTPAFAHHNENTHRVLIYEEETLPLTFRGCVAHDAVENLIFEVKIKNRKGFLQTWNSLAEINVCGTFDKTSIIPHEVIFVEDDKSPNSDALKFLRFTVKDKDGEWYIMTNWPVRTREEDSTSPPSSPVTPDEIVPTSKEPGLEI